jgi:uncharacterized delta-60 repeat protein
LGGGGTGTTTRNHIGRLNADGSLDPNFNPGTDRPGVLGLVVQPDARILIVGSFSGLGGGTGTTPRNGIGRLNVDGSVDMSFDPGGAASVPTLALQSDGKILVGETTLTFERRIVRFNADGSPDFSFNAGQNSIVRAIALEAEWEDPGRRFLLDVGHDVAKSDRQAHEYRRSAPTSQRHRRWQRRDLAAQRGRAGRRARDV